MSTQAQAKQRGGKIVRRGHQHSGGVGLGVPRTVPKGVPHDDDTEMRKKTGVAVGVAFASNVEL